MKFNYHTHTERCMHAGGKDEDFVLAAIKAGFDEIGFSDHCAWPYKNYASPIRMTEVQIEDYVNSVKSLREKYKDKISIKLGFECEYFERHIPWLRETLKKYSFDYIILGHHYLSYEIGGLYTGNAATKEEIEVYKDDLIKAMDTGLYSYIAHPDLFFKGYGRFDGHAEKVTRQIIKKAIETDTPLEYNLLGLARNKADNKDSYPYPDFWRIAGEMGAKGIIGIDAHFPDAYLDKELMNEAVKSLEEYGVRMVDKIKLLDEN